MSQSAAPRVVDNDSDEITVTLDGKEIRGWSYRDETERRVKMLAAREFCEGWFQATNHEKERIAQALDYEASVTPCEEDAVVTRNCARLVRADFSYEAAEQISDEEVYRGGHLRGCRMCASDGIGQNCTCGFEEFEERRAALAKAEAPHA